MENGAVSGMQVLKGFDYIFDVLFDLPLRKFSIVFESIIERASRRILNKKTNLVVLENGAIKFNNLGVIDALHNLDFPLYIFAVDWVFEERREYLLECVVFSMEFDPVNFWICTFSDVLLLLPLVIYAHSLVSISKEPVICSSKSKAN